MQTIRTIFTSILNIFFPISCFRCKQNGVYLCESCFTKLPKVEEKADSLFFSVFQYKEQATRDMIWSLKYKGNKDVARLLAGYMYEWFCEDLSDEALFRGFVHPLVMPIPLSKKRFRKRGFNQAELLAREFTVRDNLFTLSTNVLCKIKDTRSQTTLKNRAERMVNVIGSFEVRNTEKIKNKNIILIDDIFTTGATLNEAKKILINAGARMVLCCTVAH